MYVCFTEIDTHYVMLSLFNLSMHCSNEMIKHHCNGQHPLLHGLNITESMLACYGHFVHFFRFKITR